MATSPRAPWNDGLIYVAGDLVTGRNALIGAVIAAAMVLAVLVVSLVRGAGRAHAAIALLMLIVIAMVAFGGFVFLGTPLEAALRAGGLVGAGIAVPLLVPAVVAATRPVSSGSPSPGSAP